MLLLLSSSLIVLFVWNRDTHFNIIIIINQICEFLWICVYPYRSLLFFFSFYIAMNHISLFKIERRNVRWHKIKSCTICFVFRFVRTVSNGTYFSNRLHFFCSFYRYTNAIIHFTEFLSVYQATILSIMCHLRLLHHTHKAHFQMTCDWTVVTTLGKNCKVRTILQAITDEKMEIAM